MADTVAPPVCFDRLLWRMRLESLLDLPAVAFRPIPGEGWDGWYFAFEVVDLAGHQSDREAMVRALDHVTAPLRRHLLEKLAMPGVRHLACEVRELECDSLDANSGKLVIRGKFLVEPVPSRSRATPPPCSTTSAAATAAS